MTESVNSVPPVDAVNDEIRIERNAGLVMAVGQLCSTFDLVSQFVICRPSTITIYVLSDFRLSMLRQCHHGSQIQDKSNM